MCFVYRKWPDQARDFQFRRVPDFHRLTLRIRFSLICALSHTCTK